MIIIIKNQHLQVLMCKGLLSIASFGQRDQVREFLTGKVTCAKSQSWFGEK